MMNLEKLRRVWPLWALLAAPAVGLVLEKYILGIPGWKFFSWTGILGVAFMLVTLLATPVRRLFPRAPLGAWLVRQRRYFGVAAFAYSALHTVFWLQFVEFAQILRSFANLPVLLGWIGLFILAAMALTSNDQSVQRLGPRWKSLQRWIYLAAPVAVLHWLLLAEGSFTTPTVYAALLAMLLAMRLPVVLRRLR